MSFSRTKTVGKTAPVSPKTGNSPSRAFSRMSPLCDCRVSLSTGSPKTPAGHKPAEPVSNPNKQRNELGLRITRVISRSRLIDGEWVDVDERGKPLPKRKEPPTPTPSVPTPPGDSKKSQPIPAQQPQTRNPIVNLPNLAKKRKKGPVRLPRPNGKATSPPPKRGSKADDDPDMHNHGTTPVAPASGGKSKGKRSSRHSPSGKRDNWDPYAPKDSPKKDGGNWNPHKPKDERDDVDNWDPFGFIESDDPDYAENEGLPALRTGAPSANSSSAPKKATISDAEGIRKRLEFLELITRGLPGSFPDSTPKEPEKDSLREVYPHLPKGYGNENRDS